MEKQAILSIGKEIKNIKIDKNGYLLLKIKELPEIVSGTLTNIDMTFSDWKKLKSWVDFHYNKLLFFEQFPEEPEYAPIIADIKRIEKKENGLDYDIESKMWIKKINKSESPKKKQKWWQVWSK